MSAHANMARLVQSLHDKAAAGSPVKFWLRDDDAIEPGGKLDRLLNLTGTFHVPVTLAVIPAHTGDALAQRLAASEHVCVAVHGWSHTNHAPADEKKQELGNHRPVHEVLAELSNGLEHLEKLHRSRFVPLLVPPWNRISPDVIEQLGTLGFEAVSTFGDEKPAKMLSVNTQVDIIDWKGNRGGRPAAELAAQIIDGMEKNRSFIGVLTHHLVHDEAAWQFLQQLFEATTEHPGAHWVSINELLD